MSSLDGIDPLGISLSAREVEIIELVAEGLTNQEIADRLTISKRTVDNHVSNVFTKTGSKNRVALLNWAMDNGKICRDGFNCCVLPENDPPHPDGGDDRFRKTLQGAGTDRNPKQGGVFEASLNT